MCCIDVLHCKINMGVVIKDVLNCEVCVVQLEGNEMKYMINHIIQKKYKVR